MCSSDLSVEAAMRDSHVAINLVGILAESGAQTFDAVQGTGAGAVARAAGTGCHTEMNIGGRGC